MFTLPQKYVPSNGLPGLSWKYIYNQRQGTKAKCNHSQLIICRRLLFSDDRKFTEACFHSQIKLSRSVSEQNVALSRVSCSRLNQGHRYPSQTFHPGMWTLLQSSSSSTHTHRHWLIHRWRKVCQLYNDLKKKNVKKYRLLFVTDVCIPGYIFKTLC